MKHAMARRLHAVLGCAVYTETVQSGLEQKSCVILDPQYTVKSVRKNRVELCAEYKVAVRGLEDITEAVFYALSEVRDDLGKVYRGEEMSSETKDDITLVRVKYRYFAEIGECDEPAPMMETVSIQV